MWKIYKTVPVNVIPVTVFGTDTTKKGFSVSRTKEQRSCAKKLLRKPKGNLEPVDLSQSSYVPSWMTKAYRNNRYTVTIEENVRMTGGITAIRNMVQRHDDKPIPNHWREMQNIKNEIYGKDTVAIEYYPAEIELMDDHNIYWFWVFPDWSVPVPKIKKCR